MAEKVKLTIEFPSQEQLVDFATWLCDSGEQSYWDGINNEDDGVSSVRFHYHGVEKTEFAHNDARRYGPFMGDNIIRTSTREDD